MEETSRCVADAAVKINATQHNSFVVAQYSFGTRFGIDYDQTKPLQQYIKRFNFVYLPLYIVVYASTDNGHNDQNV